MELRSRRQERNCAADISLPHECRAAVQRKAACCSEILRAGGESGIRTHGTVSRTHAFQACALSHSAISPERPLLKGRR